MKNIIFLLFLLLISCKQESKLLALPEETPITGLDYTNELYMSYPLSVDIIKDKLLILMHKSDNVLHIVDTDNGLVVNKIGVMGGGPGEFLQPRYLGYDHSNIYLYDLRQKKVRSYKWNAIEKGEDLPKIEGIHQKDKDITILDGQILNGNYFVGNSILGLSKPIVIFDKEMNVVNNVGEIPDSEHENTALTTYGGVIDCYENKFVFAMSSLGYIAYYEQRPDGKSNLLWEHYLEEPMYKGNQLDIKQLKLAFPDIKMTKNYIFCSYFGERLTREKLKTLKPRNILVFDHQGNLLKNLRSKRSLGKFTVSEDEKTIYAATEEPEVAIIRFDISNLLK